MKKLNEAIAELNLREFSENGISIRPIYDDYDLWSWWWNASLRRVRKNL